MRLSKIYLLFLVLILFNPLFAKAESWELLGEKPGILAEYYDTASVKHIADSVFYTGKTVYPNGAGKTDPLLKNREKVLHTKIMATVNNYAVNCAQTKVQLLETRFYGENNVLLQKTDYAEPQRFNIPPGTTLYNMRQKLCVNNSVR